METNSSGQKKMEAELRWSNNHLPMETSLESFLPPYSRTLLQAVFPGRATGLVLDLAQAAFQ